MWGVHGLGKTYTSDRSHYAQLTSPRGFRAPALVQERRRSSACVDFRQRARAWKFSDSGGERVQIGSVVRGPVRAARISMPRLGGIKCL